MAADTAVQPVADVELQTVDEVFASMAPKPPKGGVPLGLAYLLVGIVGDAREDAGFDRILQIVG